MTASEFISCEIPAMEVRLFSSIDENLEKDSHLPGNFFLLSTKQYCIDYLATKLAELAVSFRCKLPVIMFFFLVRMILICFIVFFHLSASGNPR